VLRVIALGDAPINQFGNGCLRPVVPSLPFIVAELTLRLGAELADRLAAKTRNRRNRVCRFL
jgi:hypothetical protein